MLLEQGEAVPCMYDLKAGAIVDQGAVSAESWSGGAAWLDKTLVLTTVTDSPAGIGPIGWLRQAVCVSSDSKQANGV